MFQSREEEIIAHNLKARRNGFGILFSHYDPCKSQLPTEVVYVKLGFEDDAKTRMYVEVCPERHLSRMDRSSPKRRKHIPWYEEDCADAKRDLERLLRHIGKRDPMLFERNAVYRFDEQLQLSMS